MTTLLVHLEHSPLAVHLPLLAQMSSKQFAQCCQANSERRIERTATGEVVVVPPLVASWIQLDRQKARIHPNLVMNNRAQLRVLAGQAARTVTVYRPNAEPEIKESPDSVSGEPELPGFVLQMAKIW